MVRPIVQLTTDIYALLDRLWLGGPWPTEREARKAGFRGESTRFYETRQMWSRNKNRGTIRAVAMTAADLGAR